MYIKTLELKDYRNYEYLKLEFNKNINILYGDNAQGKTNILEAINIGATSKSHRKSKDDELIRINLSSKDNENKCSLLNDNAHIKIIVQKKFVEDRIDIHIKRNNKKGIAINNFVLKKLSELFGVLQIVFFYPEDLDIIKRSPANRRNFLDTDISRIDKIYVDSIINYNKLVDNRNKLLKILSNINNKNDDKYIENYNTLEIYDIKLVEYGKKIIKLREDYINNLNSIIKKIHKNLTADKENLEIIYEPSTTIFDYETNLKNALIKDLKFLNTSVGPHRDDFTFIVNSFDLKKFGSQGQKRTAALSLKLSQIEITKNKTGEMPILLLDDVLSELDTNRQKYLLNSIKGMQTIITCTGLDEFIKAQFSTNKVFLVENGKVLEV